MDILLFCLIAYSLSSIVVEQKIFEEFRNLLNGYALKRDNIFTRKVCQLIKCHFCVGMWVGIFLFLSGFNVFNISDWDFFYQGLLGSLSSYSGHLLMSYMRVKLRSMGVDSL
jgi:hypothetical protein